MSIEKRYIIPSYEQKAEQNALLARQNEILEGIWKNIDPSTKKFNAATFDYVADIIQRNFASEYFNSGDEFFVTHGDFGAQYWRILNRNNGEIYSADYSGDILVETQSFVSKSGNTNDFELKYKRYSTSTDFTIPLESEITNVRVIATKSTGFYSYDSSTGSLSFGTALPKNSLCLIEGLINNSAVKITVVGDGTTTEFDVYKKIENINTPFSSITQVTFTTENYTYTAQNGIIHIGSTDFEIPFGDIIEVDYLTSKPSLTLNMVDCLNVGLPFDSANRNFYLGSHVREFLNSREGKGAWWLGRGTNTDTAPNFLNTYDGFLKNLDKGFLKNIKKCRKITSLPNNLKSSYDNESSITTTEMIFLLSQNEINAGLNGDVAEGSIYDYYYQFSTAELNSARIKKIGTSTQQWWLRSASISTNSNIKAVSTSGDVSSNGVRADHTYGVSPVCLIG